MSEADIKARDIAVLPDGTNLPPGRGTPAQGAQITRRSAWPVTLRAAKAARDPAPDP